MELHQLRYFVAVAESGGFSRAANRCHVSQPSLSQQIIKLEEELGQRLFDRLGRTVALTEAGRALLPRARRILSEVRELPRSVSDPLEEGQGEIEVGFIPTIASFLLPPSIRRLSEQFPKARISVSEDLTDSLVRQLVGAEIELAFMSLPIANPLIETELIAEEPLLVAAPARHALAQSASITLRDLEQAPFISLSEVHCLGEQIQAFCMERQISPSVACSTVQLSTVQSCVELGLGFSLVPKLMARTDRSQACRYFELAGESPRRAIVAARRAGRSPSLLSQRIVEVVREVCLEILGSDGQ